MDVDGLGVVITGAGNGIGRALARRMAAGGARVVANDLDAAAVTLVADELGGLAVPGDGSSEEGVAALLAAARSHLGRIDVYFANAGIDLGGGVDARDSDWARVLDVNLMGHVRAARQLVPEWLETGGGRFVVTASAAGLLTMLGSAPYSVSKHASVAFAEWLSATYGHRGIVVQAICPQFVSTAMLEGIGPVRDLVEQDRAIDPAEVADRVWEAMQDDRFLILPHPEVAEYYAKRALDTDRWLHGMRKLQRRLDEG